MAAALSGNRNENGKLQDFVLCDVTPLSLGIVNGKEGSMGVFILRNSGTPITVNRISTTTFDNKCSGRVIIYEGESATGELILDNFPPCPQGVARTIFPFILMKMVSLVSPLKKIPPVRGKCLELTVMEEMGDIGGEGFGGHGEILKKATRVWWSSWFC
ncbi:hypothetical protein PRUPE_2G013200 [Prunus persica]|uniref:Uncharacterized protein n=1 Tax=Prunus persica TaxID=3760 RepID=A0A251QAH4_PRUPE|nr:hypothetical protein PRUPE_2G013200 [Prunus persica]